MMSNGKFEQQCKEDCIIVMVYVNVESTQK
jgi:hypothetical protein